jgi:hypothetical protein
MSRVAPVDDVTCVISRYVIYAGGFDTKAVAVRLIS